MPAFKKRSLFNFCAGNAWNAWSKLETLTDTPSVERMMLYEIALFFISVHSAIPVSICSRFASSPPANALLQAYL